MNKKEQELEKLVREVDENKPMSIPPIFEMYVTLFSVFMAIMLFIYPDMIINNKPQPELYKYMTVIMSQSWWAISFFISAMLKAIGLMIDNYSMRIAGLVASCVLYVLLSVCYAMSFPSLGSINFACMALFTAVSIPAVKHTSIRHGKDDENG